MTTITIYYDIFPVWTTTGEAVYRHRRSKGRRVDLVLALGFMIHLLLMRTTSRRAQAGGVVVDRYHQDDGALIEVLKVDET